MRAAMPRMTITTRARATSRRWAASPSRRSRSRFIRASSSTSSAAISAATQPQPQHYQQRRSITSRPITTPTSSACPPSSPAANRSLQPQHKQGGGQGRPRRPNGQNGQNGYDGSPDRFPLHRRRRRHRGGNGPRGTTGWIIPMSGDGGRKATNKRRAATPGYRARTKKRGRGPRFLLLRGFC